MKKILIFLIFILCINSPSFALVNIHNDNITIPNALIYLFKNSGVNYVIESNVKFNPGYISVQLNDVTLENAVHVICKLNDMKIICKKENDVYYIKQQEINNINIPLINNSQNIIESTEIYKNKKIHKINISFISTYALEQMFNATVIKDEEYNSGNNNNNINNFYSGGYNFGGSNNYNIGQRSTYNNNGYNNFPQTNTINTPGGF